MNDIETDSSEEMMAWISQYCSMFGHDYFVEVAPEFVEDDFNLTGLSSIVPFFRDALDVILDLEPEKPIQPSNVPLVEHAAELLYGLIHARFILTKQGLHLMAEKYEENCFGSCPRYYCEGMHLIPIGRYDQPGIETVRLYCPNCNDIYLPASSRYLNIDGAFFGTSFAGLFMKMFPEIERQCEERSKAQYKLKIFGFGLNEKSVAGPRMKWLRQFPKTSSEVEEFDKCEFGSPTLEELNAKDDDDDDHNVDDDDSDEKIDEDEDDLQDVRMSGGESMMSIAKD